MAVGKGSIQRAKRTLTDENTEKTVFTEAKDISSDSADADVSVAKSTSEVKSVDQNVSAQTTEKTEPVQSEKVPAAEAAPAKKTPARRGRKPGSKNKKTLAAEAAAAGTTAQSSVKAAGKAAKASTKGAGTAAKPTRKNRSAGKITAAKQSDAAKEGKKKYTQISHIQCDLPVHLL